MVLEKTSFFSDIGTILPVPGGTTGVPDYLFGTHMAVCAPTYN